MNNERKIPKRTSILYPLMGKDEDCKDEDFENLYVKHLEKFERKCEDSLIKTFSRLDIRGTVKTDPYSLPFNNEVVVTLQGESYLNGAYEVFRVARPIIKELLNKNIYSLRFYMFINVEESFPMGKVEYRFRYHVK